MRLTKRLSAILLLLAALLAAYAVAGFWWAPRLIRAEFNEFVSADLGKTPRLGEVRVNPFTLRVIVSDLGIDETNSDRLVGFGTLDLDLSIRSVWKRGAVFDDITLVDPYVDAVLGTDRRLNLSGLLPPDTPNTDAENSRPVPVFIDRFAVRNGRAAFEDRTRSRLVRAELRPINILLEDFSTEAGSGNQYRINAASAAGETFSWSGSFELAPFSARGRFALGQLRANTIENLLQDSLPFDLPRGRLSLGGGYQFSAATTPLSGKVTLDTLVVADLALQVRGRSTPDIEIGRLTVSNASVDLAARQVDLGLIGIDDARIRTWLDTRGVSLAALAGENDEPAAGAATALPKATPAAPTTTTADDSAPWQLRLPELRLRNARADLEDRTLPKAAKFTVSGIEATLRGWSNSPEALVRFNTTATINEAGRIDFSGETRWGNFDTQAHLTLGSLDITDFEPYFADLVRLNVRRGLIDVEGNLAWQPASVKGAEKLEFEGDAAIRRLLTQDRLVRRTLLAWDALRLNDIRYSETAQRLDIRSIDTAAPFIDLVVNADGSTNIADVFASGSTTESPTANRSPAASGSPRAGATRTEKTPPEAAPLRIAIGQVNIAAGSANFADFSVRPNFRIGIQTLAGRVTGLSSDADSRAQVSLEGGVDRYAPVKISGEVNYLSADAYTKLAATFRNIELTSFNPYSSKFMGYRIEKGKLSIDTNYFVEQRRLKANHKILISQLQLGEKVKSPDATKLPLKLAIALLKDRNGDISLDLPVGGTLDDPTFRLGPIIWKIVLNLLVKIVTAPFALLGALFGGGPDVQFIDFAPASAMLEPALRERLVGIRKALIERPGLELDVPPVFSRELDAPQMLRERWSARLQQFAGRPVDPADREDYLELLKKLHREQLGSRPTDVLRALAEPDQQTGQKPDETALLKASIKTLEELLQRDLLPTDKDLEELARARARVVQDALLESGEVDPLRVFLRNPTAIAGTANSVRLKVELRN
jgi:hypothetical protein